MKKNRNEEQANERGRMEGDSGPEDDRPENRQPESDSRGEDEVKENKTKKKHEKGWRKFPGSGYRGY